MAAPYIVEGLETGKVSLSLCDHFAYRQALCRPWAKLLDFVRPFTYPKDDRSILRISAEESDSCKRVPLLNERDDAEMERLRTLDKPKKRKVIEMQWPVLVQEPKGILQHSSASLTCCVQFSLDLRCIENPAFIHYLRLRAPPVASFYRRKSTIHRSPAG